MSLTSTTFLSKAEKSYIQAGIVASPPSRADGRSLLDYRSVALETGVAPLANGSARLSIQASGGSHAGGTEVLAATKLEVETVGGGVDGGIDGGRIVCSVTCSPSAYAHHTSSTLEDLQHDLSSLLHTTLSHPTLRPLNLGILPGKKSWLLSLDILVMAAEAGNVVDALFMAARAALWDTKVPRTRAVEYRAAGTTKSTSEAKGKGKGKLFAATIQDDDVDMDPASSSGFDTRRQMRSATDFELPDYWDEGEVLGGRERWPICVTLNLEHPVHYLDASGQEEATTALKLLLMFSFPPNNEPADVRAMRLLGSGEIKLEKLKELIKIGEAYARDIFTSLEAKLQDEDVRQNKKARERFQQHR